jgi:hypothetical protein
MPRCLKCGKVYSSKYVSGLCDNCAGAVITKPVYKPEAAKSAASNTSTKASKRPDSSSSEISLEKYEEAVAKYNKDPSAIIQRSRTTGFNVITLVIFVVLLLASLSLVYFVFGLSKHFGLWSAALVFFFIGSAMIVTKRLIVGRSVNADQYAQIEPTAAASIGGMCLLPLVMCTFYYGFNSDLPGDRAFWMVGSMTFLAFLALVGVAFALSRESEPAP